MAGLPTDIATDIGKQVEHMILNAKQQSEAKVNQEIQKIRMRIEQMKEKIKAITARLEAASTPQNALLKTELQKSIAKLEEVWEGEVGTLKHELWQTIQAHNHNADLMKHHKDAIEAMQGELVESSSSPEADQLMGLLNQVDTIKQRETARQQQMDQFIQRFSLAQQQLASSATLGAAAWQMSGLYAGGVPGGLDPRAIAALGGGGGGLDPRTLAAMGGAGGLDPRAFAAMGGAGMLPGQGLAATMPGQGQGKKDGRKAAKAKPKQNNQANAAAAGNLQLRAEAAEFVPGAFS